MWRPKVLQEAGRGWAQGTPFQQGHPVGLQNTEWDWGQLWIPFASWPMPSKQLRTPGSAEMGNRVGTNIN